MSRIWIWTLTMGFIGALGVPNAMGESRGDANRFKQDVLKAVDRLMDKKLKEFKHELMGDIKKLLAQGREGHVRRAVPAAPQAQKKYAQAKRIQVKKGAKGPFVHVEKPRHEQSQSEVQVIHGPDGKVHVRVVRDGKVMERVFQPGDPEMHRWMKKMVPSGMHVEQGAEGKSRMRVRSGKQGRTFVIEKRQREEDGEERCECGRKKGRRFGLPFAGREGRAPKVKIEGLRKVLPFGENFDPKELGPWIRRMVEQWKEQGFEPERIREFVKKVQGQHGRKLQERFKPFERAGRGMERAMRRKPMELVRRARPHIEVEVEELEKEKENLKRELREIRKLLERLIDQRRGR
ncbi:MAG: hypothetical protein ACYTFG_03970 [Planctomycetota bacterium]|jgi:hypothetical protein